MLMIQQAILFQYKTLPIELYDQTTLLNLEASRLFNNRFMYHSLEAGIGARDKNFGYMEELEII